MCISWVDTIAKARLFTAVFCSLQYSLLNTSSHAGSSCPRLVKSITCLVLLNTSGSLRAGMSCPRAFTCLVSFPDHIFQAKSSLGTRVAWMLLFHPQLLHAFSVRRWTTFTSAYRGQVRVVWQFTAWCTILSSHTSLVPRSLSCMGMRLVANIHKSLCGITQGVVWWTPEMETSRQCHWMHQLPRSLYPHMSQDCRKKWWLPYCCRESTYFSLQVSMQFRYLALTNHILVFWVATYTLILINQWPN